MERHSFRIVSGGSTETLRKLYISGKFAHHEIRWSFGVLHSGCDTSQKAVSTDGLKNSYCENF